MNAQRAQQEKNSQADQAATAKSDIAITKVCRCQSPTICHIRSCPLLYIQDLLWYDILVTGLKRPRQSPRPCYIAKGFAARGRKKMSLRIPNDHEKACAKLVPQRNTLDMT